MTAPLTQKASITRDSLGVPHISAGSVEDAIFLQGFATAQDRLWQMDALRRLASGQLAEVIGPAAIESDRSARRLRIRQIAEAQLRELPPSERAVLAAYTRGVNFFIESNRGRFPVEFTILRYEPRPWTSVDTLAIGIHMFRTLTDSWEEELQKRALIRAGDRAKVEFLFPIRQAAESQPGSNAWAIAGRRTASGKPLLASDPHLEPSFPSIWHMVHLKAPGLNVSGVAFPGVPCVIIGHNDHIAWGITNLQFDVQDLYQHRFDTRTGRYYFRGQVEQARLEREEIVVRGQGPVEVARWVTRHGPIVAGSGSEQFALRWTAASTAGFRFPMLELNQAANWEDFRAVLSRYSSPPQNFIYADRYGNIGYQAAGKLPIRRNHDGDVPADGSEGRQEWDGYIPFEEMPRIYNPQAGLIVSANENPFPENFPYRVSGSFAPGYRFRQIQSLLQGRNGWKAVEMLDVQKDVYSAFSHSLARQAVAAYGRQQKPNAAVSDAIDILRGWNGQMDRDGAAPLVATLLYQHLRKAIAEQAAPGKGLAYSFEMAPAVVDALFEMRPAGWFSDYDAALLESLHDAVDEGRRMQGSDIRKWRYGYQNRILLRHPVLSQLPLVGSYFQIGPAPLDGSSTTIKQTTGRRLPSMRMVADCSDWDNSFQNILTGVSGHPLSRNFRDQWEAHRSGRSFSMQFRNIEAARTLTIEPERD